MRRIIAICLCDLMVLFTTEGLFAGLPPAPSQKEPQTINDYTRESYLQLFKEADSLPFSSQQLSQAKDRFEKAKDKCGDNFKKRRDRFKDQVHGLQDQLKKGGASISDQQRHQMHCQIQNLETLRSQADVLSNHAIPIGYDNKIAKVELMQNWPADLKKIEQQKADGSYRNRRWGDVQDIGRRVIAKGQKDDIKTGKDAVKQMKQTDLLPKEVENKVVVDYVKKLAQKVASHSDLKVPLHVTVLNSKEINAFALPGGYLFVERGLLEAADDESEVAGVIGHEIGHVVARHGHQLMTRSTIAGIIFMAAQVAASVLTGGAAGIGTYYALQYGFYGLGMLLDLNLLGVSRDFELQADQLGIQYAWASGYDPSGFIRFFDKMATKVGYVNGLSWFRSHPPFYQRMVDAEREILFLPRLESPVVQTPEFEAMKKELAKVVEKAKKEQERANQQLVEKGCPKPDKVEYKPDEPIENICSMPIGQ